MTEKEWPECVNPQQMLQHLSKSASNRRIRLFNCACCRRYWRLVDKQHKDMIELVEQFADGKATKGDLKATFEKVRVFSGMTPKSVLAQAVYAAAASHRLPWERSESGRAVAEQIVTVSARIAASKPLKHGDRVAASHAKQRARNKETGIQANFLRDIFANPFQSLATDPRWLTSTVVDLANAIYAERAFERLPILGDALQDAGCDNEEIIAHCRSEGPHVRGCWVVDLLLGKE